MNELLYRLSADEKVFFLSGALDAITDRVVIIGSGGEVEYSNLSWKAFTQTNAGQAQSLRASNNYLVACDTAAAAGDSYSAELAVAVRKLLYGEPNIVNFEYPAEILGEQHWFLINAVRYNSLSKSHCIITHKDITAKKRAESALITATLNDELTGIGNLRRFRQFIESEWQRCMRGGHSIALAYVDIDYLKTINDKYGHPTGDSCLRTVADTLKTLLQRPTDCCARIGGDEFAIVFAEAHVDEANVVVTRMLNAIRRVKLTTDATDEPLSISASIGLAGGVPQRDQSPDVLITAADESLYRAKHAGRNQIACTELSL